MLFQTPLFIDLYRDRYIFDSYIFGCRVNAITSQGIFFFFCCRSARLTHLATDIWSHFILVNYYSLLNKKCPMASVICQAFNLTPIHLVFSPLILFSLANTSRRLPKETYVGVNSQGLVRSLSEELSH